MLLNFSLKGYSQLHITTNVVWSNLDSYSKGVGRNFGILIDSGGYLTIDEPYLAIAGIVSVGSIDTLKCTESIRFYKHVSIEGTGIFEGGNIIEFDDNVSIDDGVVSFDGGNVVNFKSELLITGTVGGVVEISSPFIFPVASLSFNGKIDILKGTLTLFKQNASIGNGSLYVFDISNGGITIINSKVVQSSVLSNTNIGLNGFLKIINNSNVTMKAVSIIGGLLEVEQQSEFSFASLNLLNAIFNADNSTINVEPGKTISVDKSIVNATNSTFNMGINSQITIQSSCENQLNATETTFKNKNANETWHGIKVVKDMCVSTQFLIPPTIGSSGNCNQAEWAGVLASLPTKIIMNNCSISNAAIGINADGEEFANSNIGGAIVRLRDCGFINCEKGVRIAGYYKDKPNASYIMTCDFEWNDDLPSVFTTKTPTKLFLILTHIELFALDNGAVNIGGCHFKNLNTQKFGYLDKGIGILAKKSSFNVSSDGDKCCGGENGPCPDNCFAEPGKQSRRNVFEKLGIGIKTDLALTTRGGALPANKFACRNANFNDCIVGISIENGRDVLIGLNSFTVDKSNIDDYFIAGTTTNPNIIGVSLKNSSGNRIYENVFSTVDNNFEYTVGIRSESPNLTQTSFIRKNTFSTATAVTTGYSPENVRAIDLYNNNNYLDITCNTFTNQVFDVRVNTGATLNDLPDMTVHNINGPRFGNNIWSNLPTSIIPDPLQAWKTQGPSSNVFNSTSITEVFHRYDNPDVKFNTSSFLNINRFFDQPSCGNGGNNCVDCSTDCMDLEVTKVGNPIGMNDLMNKNTKMIVFPNPASSDINVVFNKSCFGENVKFRLFDSQGKLLLESTPNGNEFKINLSNYELKSGMYIVELSGSNTSGRSKLIINHF